MLFERDRQPIAIAKRHMSSVKANKKMSTQSEYAQIVNRLCHIVPLSREGKAKDSVDNVILATLALGESYKPSNIGDVISAVEDFFHQTLTHSAVQASLERLLSSRRLIHNKATGLYSVSPQIVLEKQKKTQEFAQLQEQVREDWFSSIEHDLSPQQQEQLWKCLMGYMARAFYRHGAESVALLSASSDAIHHVRTRSSYLAEAINENCDETSRELAEEIIPKFFQDSPPLRATYVARQVDATFTLFAISLDQATSRYLKQSLTPLKIFLDTNFIFAILGLTDSQLVDVSQELVAFIQTHKLPFKLVYHEETLRELQFKIDAVRSRIKGRPASALSREIVRKNMLSGLYLSYHRTNAKEPISPEVFFSKFNDLPGLLEQFGFEKYRDPISHRETVMERGELNARYDAFLTAHERSKDYKPRDHDVTVWLAVQRLRTAGTNILESGALFLTIDYFFQRFEKQELKKELEEVRSVGAVVLPDHLLQLLRPFVPQTEDSDRRFVETFGMLEIRAIGVDYSGIRDETLSYIGYLSGLPETTQLEILRKELINHHLEQLEKQDLEVTAVIDSALVEINQIVTGEREDANKRAEQRSQELENMRGDFQKILHDVESIKTAEQHATSRAAEAESIATQQSALLIKLEEKETERRIRFQQLKENERKASLKAANLWMCGLATLTLTVFFMLFVQLSSLWIAGWSIIEPYKELITLSMVVVSLVLGVNINPYNLRVKLHQWIQDRIFAKKMRRHEDIAFTFGLDEPSNG
jgi:antitoxin component of RelBE/YafQ-DinJ toxin-antitoxin module